MNDQPQSLPENWIIPAVLGGICWYAVPVVLRIWVSEQNDELAWMASKFIVGVLSLGVAAGICAHSRNKQWIMTVWMPPTILGTIGGIAILFRLIEEVRTLMGSPFGQLAMIVGSVAMVLWSLPLVSLWLLRPKRWPRALVIASLLNTAAIGAVALHNDYEADRQEFIIHIRNLEGKPIEGAMLHYYRIGYGPGGKDDPSGSGQVLSGRDGIVRPHARRFLQGISGTISHPDYQQVDIKIDRRYKGDTTRHVTIGRHGRRHVERFGTIDAVKVPTFYAYLHQISGCSAIRSETSTIIRNTPGVAYFDLETGKFGEIPHADLLFEVFFENKGPYSYARLRIRGIGGTKLRMFTTHVDFSSPVESPEHMFSVAPASGYIDEVEITRPGNLPGQKIFARDDNSNIYAMFAVQMHTFNLDKVARIHIDLIRNKSTPNLCTELSHPPL